MNSAVPRNTAICLIDDEMVAQCVNIERAEEILAYPSTSRNLGTVTNDSLILHEWNKIVEPCCATRKRLRWNEKEINRLRVALKALIKPRTDDHWGLIARFVGRHSGSDCQRKANQLSLRIHSQRETLSSPANISPVRGRRRRPLRNKNANNNNMCHREAEGIVEESEVNVDYFADENACDFDVLGMEDLSSLDLDPDDSLLLAVLTPKERVRRPRRPFFAKIAYDERTQTASEVSSDLSFGG